MTNFVTLTSCVQPHPSVKMNNKFFFKNKKSLHTCDKFQDPYVVILLTRGRHKCVVPYMFAVI